MEAAEACNKKCIELGKDLYNPDLPIRKKRKKNDLFKGVSYNEKTGFYEAAFSWKGEHHECGKEHRSAHSAAVALNLKCQAIGRKCLNPGIQLSRYIGVSKNDLGTGWKAEVHLGRVKKYYDLGIHDREELAAISVNKKYIELGYDPPNSSEAIRAYQKALQSSDSDESIYGMRSQSPSNGLASGTLTGLSDRSPKKVRTSQYNGCTWKTETNSWKGQVIHQGKHHYVGNFKSEKACAFAVNDFCTRIGKNPLNPQLLPEQRLFQSREKQLAIAQQNDNPKGFVLRSRF
eukprot:UN24681